MTTKRKKAKPGAHVEEWFASIADCEYVRDKNAASPPRLFGSEITASFFGTPVRVRITPVSKRRKGK